MMASLFPDHWHSTPGKQRGKIFAVNFPHKHQTLIITDLRQKKKKKRHIFVLTRFWRRFGDPISFQFFLQVHIDYTIRINDTKQDSITKETCNHNKPRSGASIWGYNWRPFLFRTVANVCLTLLHAVRNWVPKLAGRQPSSYWCSRAKPPGAELDLSPLRVPRNAWLNACWSVLSFLNSLTKNEKRKS